jgi:copper homeostasis protein
MEKSYLFEICVDSIDGAAAAQTGGGNRIELCDNLLEGGTTPSYGIIRTAIEILSIPVNVIIRPRGGDFCYSANEFSAMRYDVQAAKELGANGVVIGLLEEDGTVDIERTRQLVELARPLSITFHRAFDMARDPFEALETLIGLGIERVLTSGQEVSVLEGIDTIKALVQQAGDRIIVMPGGDITERNIGKVAGPSGAKEFHFAAMSSLESRMSYRNHRPFMGGALRPPEFSRMDTDAQRVAGVIRLASAG